MHNVGTSRFDPSAGSLGVESSVVGVSVDIVELESV